MQEKTNPDDIVRRLRDHIRKQFQVPEDDGEFSDDINLFDYGYIDSFGAVELTSFVEKSFSIKVRQADLVAYPMNSIREIADFVSKRQKGEI
jgi:methoxymalonate biosynthesis acyl carrier protein